ncbi:MAG: ParA family protein, partial [bacterium]|nr:ParA family protein [bacterium]
IRFDQGEKPDISQHLIPLSATDDLYLLPAGLPDAEYARRLRFIDPAAWYREERNPLRLLLDGVVGGLSFTPDVILLDARTGITPLSGPLLFDLADLAVIVFFPHPQARTGTAALVRGLLAARTRRSTPERALAPEPRFIVSPIPAIKGPEVAKRYEHRPIEWIAEWLRPVNDARVGKDQDPLVEGDVTHFIRYRQDLATSDVILPDSEVRRVFEP